MLVTWWIVAFLHSVLDCIVNHVSVATMRNGIVYLSSFLDTVSFRFDAIHRERQINVDNEMVKCIILQE